MKPCYALLSTGQYTALHNMLGFNVETEEDGQALVLAMVSPTVLGKSWDSTVLYTWSAYPGHNAEAAVEMLSRLMIHLASDHPDAGGIIDMDDLAADIVSELGLESVAPVDPRKEAAV
jgi:hypothetical protein